MYDSWMDNMFPIRKNWGNEYPYMVKYAKYTWIHNIHEFGLLIVQE